MPADRREFITVDRELTEEEIASLEAKWQEQNRGPQEKARIEMIPANLEECICELQAQLPAHDVGEIKKMDEDEFLAVVHHGLGRSLRNKWGLWQKDSVLCVYFKNLGVWHADDMSGLILRSFHRHLHGKPLDVEAQVAYYKAYWEGKGLKPED